MARTEKLFNVVFDGNYTLIGGGIPMESLRKLLEDKNGDEGFNLPRDTIEDVLKKVDKLELGKIKDLKSIIVKCDSEEFGKGNGSIEISRAYW